MRFAVLITAFVIGLCWPHQASAQDNKDNAKAPAKPEAPSPESDVPQIPIDLIADEHIREEFGINEFTTPSIKRLFEDLDALGTMPYGSLKRDYAATRIPPDRSLLALNMGVLIADGFLVVHSEKVDELEAVGRSVLDHARALGARSQVARHAKSLLQGSLLGDWNNLKTELALTQADVEAEMILLRDAEIAQLISLGGWVRALQIAATTASENYSPDRASLLGRLDVAEYYLATITHLNPHLRDRAHIAGLTEGISALVETIDVPQGKKFSEEDVSKIQGHAQQMLDAILKPKPAAPKETPAKKSPE